MSEFSERETCDFFGHRAVLSIEERNDLDEYLWSLSEFKEWDEAGLMLRLKEKVLKASARCGAPAESIDEVYKQIVDLYGRHRELQHTIRRKIKAWCRATVEEAA